MEKITISSEVEAQIKAFLADNFKIYKYTKEMDGFDGQEEIRILINIDNIDIFKALNSVSQLINTFQLDYVKLESNGHFINVDDNYICCGGATMIINKESINEKYEGATKDLITDLLFKETSRYLYFTGDPRYAPAMDGMAYKFLSWKVMMNLPKYMECEYWTYYGGELDLPDWITGSHDYGDMRFIIW